MNSLKMHFRISNRKMLF